MATNAELTTQVVIWLLGFLGTLVTGYVIPAAVNYIKSKTKNERLKYITEELATTISTAVDYTNQTYVNQLKKDGKFDLESQKEALNKAAAYAIDNLSATAIDILQKEAIDLEDLITKKIEAKISSNKYYEQDVNY